jgi:acyl carrier protein
MSASPPCRPLLEWLQTLPTRVADRAIGMDTELIDGGLLDSLGILELVSFLEETFSLALPLEEFVPESFRTPAAILSMIDRLSEPARGGAG